MSIVNGVWHDAVTDLPKDHESVLAVKQLKNGRKEICIAYCMRNYKHYDPISREEWYGPYWVCGGNNNIILWMPLPKIPEKGE